MAENPPSLEPLRPPETPIDAGSQALAEALRSSFGVVKFVMILLVCLFIGSGFFTVGPQEQAIIIRLGRPVGEGQKALLGPGLHWSLPYPIDEYRKVPITAIQKVTSTVGWFAITPEQELVGLDKMAVPAGTPMNPLVDGYVLTADKNILHARATLTFHISDPIAYLFNFANASNAVQNALDNALLYTASRFTVDDILTRDRVGFNEAVRKRVVQLVQQNNQDQDLGIEVEQCLVESRAPRQLQTAFEDVIKAAQTGEKARLDGNKYANQVMAKASADAQSRKNVAESDRTRLVNDIRSQAERFSELLPKVRENPSLFAQQRLAETLAKILPNLEYKIYVTEGAEGKPKELRITTNKDIPKAKEEQKP